MLFSGCILLNLQGCNDSQLKENITLFQEQTMLTNKIQLIIKDKTFTVSLEDNKAAKELIEILKEKDLTLALSDYGGFEKVGSIGKRLTTTNKHITTNAGDIVLYNGDQIVIFYGSNTWSYTKIGKVNDLSEWTNVLGDKDIEITLSIRN